MRSPIDSGCVPASDRPASFDPLAAPGGPVEVETPFALAVVGEGDVPPHAGRKLGRAGIPALGIAAETERDLQAPAPRRGPADRASSGNRHGRRISYRAERLGAIGVRVPAWALSQSSSVNGPRGLRSGRFLHQRPVLLVLDRPAAEAFQATAETSRGAQLGAVERGGVAVAGGVGELPIGELPQPDHVVAGGVIAGVAGFPRLAHWHGRRFGCQHAGHRECCQDEKNADDRRAEFRFARHGSHRKSWWEGWGRIIPMVAKGRCQFQHRRCKAHARLCISLTDGGN